MRNVLTMVLEEKKQLTELIRFAQSIQNTLLLDDEAEGKKTFRRRIARKMFKPKVDYYLLQQLFPLIDPDNV